LDRNTISRVLVALCGLAVVLAGSTRAPLHQIEGTVVIAAGHSLTVVNEQTDPTGVEFPMGGVRFEPHEALKPGAHVRVWYRLVGDRRPIVDRVRVVAN